MTTTPDTLPTLCADGTRIVAVIREPQPEINDDFARGLGEYIRCGELPGAGPQHAAEIVRRSNDYPALAARLERAMRLLHCFVDAERFSGRGSFPMCSDAAALLAEHEKEARP